MRISDWSSAVCSSDLLIKTVPEVESVHGKLGRAETATDPAPVSMVETVIRLKPRDEWRPGVTLEGLKTELDRSVRIPIGRASCGERGWRNVSNSVAAVYFKKIHRQ